MHLPEHPTSTLLNEVAGLNCIGTYATGEEAVEKIPLNPPDVALVDVHLPGMSGIECVAKLKAQLPKLQILMLTRIQCIMLQAKSYRVLSPF